MARTYKEREVTRQQAIRWLEAVDPDKQRNMNVGVARRYAADMKSGDWYPGTQNVAFDRNGKLINGQHVLNAIILSELPRVTCLVSNGHDPGAFAGFDKNRKRSAKDDLKIKGVDRASDVASVATVIWQWERGFFKGTSYTAARSGDNFPTAAEVCRVVADHPGIQQHLHRNAFRGKGYSVGALRAASYILHHIDERNAKKFFESLIEGIGIPSKAHPIAVLRDAIMNMGRDERWRTGDTLARVFKAWNAFVRKQDITGPLLKKNEPFPEIGPPPEPIPIREKAVK